MNTIAAAITGSGVGEAGQVSDRPGSAIPARLRRVGRMLGLLFFSAVALLHIGVMRPFVGAAGRANWLHRWCRFACRLLGLRLLRNGAMPESGLLVSNHLSYLDIIALSALRPCLFVAKHDVRSWPLFGWLARAGGTIFVERNCRAGTAGEVRRIAVAIESGPLVVLFPEGTSSDGTTVLPFKSSLLEAAIMARSPISAAAIDYRLADGSVGDEVCYWRDMTFVPHLLNLLGKEGIEVRVRFSPSRCRPIDRKTLARELRAEVAALRR